MFAVTGLQPQVLLPQLGSVWQAVRTLTQGVQTPRPRITPRSRSTAVQQTDPTDTDISEGVSETLRALNLSEVQVDFERLLPRSLDNHVSAASFYENKHGFTEQDLLKTQYVDSVRLPIVTSKLLSTALRYREVQNRHFHTKRDRVASTSAGVGMKSTKLGSIQPKKSVAPLDDLVKDLTHDKHPTLKNIIELAVYKGYHVKKDEPLLESAQNKWKIRVIVFSIFFLTYVTIRLWSSGQIGSGDVRFNVLSRVSMVHPEEVNVTFDDVKGIDEAKEELKDIVEFLRDPVKFRALGAKLPKGVLLVGGPGIGKTLLARAVAGEADVPFFRASGSEFDELFVGTGAKRVRQLFNAAKAHAPCLIFIDEIDSVGAKRSSSQIHPYANQTINQLLTEMDGFVQNEGVIVIGATNRRDNLDPALLRPGRFDVEVRVFPPVYKGRCDILRHYMERIKVSSDVDVDRMARLTTGCSGADLENIVNQAALQAAKENCREVGMLHLEYARDKILMGPQCKTNVPDKMTNKITAYHEAGHTVVAHFTKDSRPVHKVTIIRRGSALGVTHLVAEKDDYNLTRSQLLAQMDVAMGGRVAEEIIFGKEKVTTGASSDFDAATNIATAMVKKYGMSEIVGVRVFSNKGPDTSVSTNEMVDAEIKLLLSESYERARSLLLKRSKEHKSLAEALLEHETLDDKEIETLIKGKTLNKPKPRPSKGTPNAIDTTDTTDNTVPAVM